MGSVLLHFGGRSYHNFNKLTIKEKQQKVFRYWFKKITVVRSGRTRFVFCFICSWVNSARQEDSSSRWPVYRPGSSEKDSPHTRSSTLHCMMMMMNLITMPTKCLFIGKSIQHIVLVSVFFSLEFLNWLSSSCPLDSFSFRRPLF